VRGSVSANADPLDAGQLVAALHRHGVDYVIIGGIALQAHGHVRTTQDLDIIAAWTPDNLARLAATFAELDARLRGVDADLLGIDLTSGADLYRGANFLVHTRHGDLDVFTVDETPGAPRTYEALRERAILVEVRGITMLIAHAEHLIRMKTAAAQLRDRPDAKRHQDLDDVAVLNRLLDADPPQSGPATPLRRSTPTRRAAARPPRRRRPTLEP
jgi:hypothetical protein